ncbi:MAG: peptidase S41, partial [Rhizomicrobium sp.]
MKSYALTGLGIAAGFCAGLAMLSVAHGADSDSQSAYQALDRFGQAFAVVRARYADAPDDKLMVENALNGMITSLDPHSSYFDPKTYAEMQVKTEGQYGGLGLVISVDNGAIKIVSPMDDTPAS